MKQGAQTVDASSSVFATVEQALADLAAGRPVVVVDDEDRENEGDIVFAAQHATPELVAFAMLHCRGLICVPMEGERLDALQLGPMTSDNRDGMGTAFTVSTDARTGITTGISAADRARTIAVLAGRTSTADDLVRPGHVFPLRAQPGGVLQRRGHTEAAVDLARLAGLEPAGVICEIANPDGTMSRLPELVAFCQLHGLKLLTIAALVDHRLRTEGRQVVPVVETRLPLATGTFRAVGYRGLADGGEHLALVHGDLGEGEDVLVGIHRECVVGEVFGSTDCRCPSHVESSLEAVAQRGRGAVLYVRGDVSAGSDELLERVAQPDDTRQREPRSAHRDSPEHTSAQDWAACDIGAQMLIDLGVRSVRLLDAAALPSVVLRSHGLQVTG